MPEDFHKTIPIQIWVDVDVGIVEMVRYLNTIPGVRTHASCQGTIGEGGPSPYRPQVMVTWTDEVFARLQREFDVTIEGDHWGYLHPRNKNRGQQMTSQPPIDNEHVAHGKTPFTAEEIALNRSSALELARAAIACDATCDHGFSMREIKTLAQAYLGFMTALPTGSADG